MLGLLLLVVVGFATADHLPSASKFAARLGLTGRSAAILPGAVAVILLMAAVRWTVLPARPRMWLDLLLTAVLALLFVVWHMQASRHRR